ncbi:MAG: GumC family protein [Fusobacteriota bacterium]
MEKNKDLELSETRREETYYEDEIDLMDLIKVIWQNKYIIIATTIIITILGIIITLNQEEIYVSELTFTREASSGGGLSALSSNPLASLAGFSSGGSGGIDVNMIMKSRTHRLKVVEQANLFDYYITKNEIDLEEIELDNRPTDLNVANWIKELVTINQDDKTGLYTISVELSDPKMAKKIADTYYDIFEDYVKKEKKTKSKQNKTFLEKQLKRVEDKLEDQEEELKAIEKKYDTISILDEAKAVTEIMAQQKKKILELSGQLQIARQFAGSENIEVKKIEEELKVYKEQLENLKHGKEDMPVKLIALNDIPDIKLKMVRLQRELEATVEVYKMVLKEFETAKLEEVQDSDILNIIDGSLAPKRPSKPNKRLNVVIAFVLGGFLGIFIAFFKEFINGVDWSKLQE